jgi:hypothetical protein
MASRRFLNPSANRTEDTASGTRKDTKHGLAHQTGPSRQSSRKLFTAMKNSRIMITHR